MNADECQTLPSVVSIVEAILFASDRPVTFEELRSAVPEADEDSLLAALEELEQEYLGSEVRGVVMQEIAGGYQLTTRPEVGIHVERFLVGKRRSRLSRAALETLATIAYRQPITRGDIEELRGVDSGHVVHRLLERDLITVRGRSEALGRPLLYGTTTEFLRFFGVSSLADLPALEEFEALSSDDPLDDPEIREALETQGLWSEDESAGVEEDSDRAVAANGNGDVPTNGNGAVAENGPTNGNGHVPANGNGSVAENGTTSGNGHAPTNGNGRSSADGSGAATENGATNGTGHAPTNGNGHSPADGNGHGKGNPDASPREDGADTGQTVDEGGDERIQVERAEGGGFVPETAVSAELEPPSFGDDEDEFPTDDGEADARGTTLEEADEDEDHESEARAEDGSETRR